MLSRGGTVFGGMRVYVGLNSLLADGCRLVVDRCQAPAKDKAITVWAITIQAMTV